jgi:hypothetical protein
MQGILIYLSISLLLPIEKRGGKSEWPQERFEKVVDRPNSSIHHKIQCVHGGVTGTHSCISDCMSNLHGSTAESVAKIHGGVAHLHRSVADIVAECHRVAADHVGSVHGHVADHLDGVGDHAAERVTLASRELGAQVGIIIGTAVGTLAATTANLVHLLSKNIATLSIVAYIQTGVKSTTPEGSNSTANSGGSGPQHLAVMSCGVRELILSYTCGREHADLVKPRIYGGYPVILQTRPGVKRLVDVLSDTEPLYLSAVRAVMLELTLVRQSLGNPGEFRVPL